MFNTFPAFYIENTGYTKQFYDASLENKKIYENQQNQPFFITIDEFRYKSTYISTGAN